MNSFSIGRFAAVLPLLASVAPALADPDVPRTLAAMREELAQLKAVYEQRIAALEQRLATAERSAPAAAAAAAAPVAPVPAAAAPAGGFNPEISLILSGMATATARDPRQDVSGAAGRERRVQGLLPAGGEASPEARGFSLAESELAISANIDPTLRGTFLLSIGPDSKVELEEAHIQTLGLGHGLGLKAGRFFSGIGYANEKHPHSWDFSNASLVHAAFFGDRLAYDGVQLKWLAPTEQYLEFGLESGRARGFPATDGERHKNGLLSGSAFVRLGGDLGLSHSWRLGASAATAQAREREYEDRDSTGTQVKNRFSGSSTTLGLDLVWKWAPAGNAAARSFVFQSEWFRRREAGRLTYDAEAASLGTASDRYRTVQDGGYAQGVWQFMPRWRVGYRYDQLTAARQQLGLMDSGTLTAADLPLLAPYRATRQTAMIDWSPSEFTRVRLQYAQDRTRRETVDDQLWLHYIVSLGAHGAHSF